MQIISIQARDDPEAKLWEPPAPITRYPSPDGKMVASFAYQEEVRMGLPVYSVRIGSPESDTIDSKPLAWAGAKRRFITRPEGSYQPWTWDSSRILMIFHKAAPALFHPESERLDELSTQKHWYANVSCSHRAPYAYLCNRYSWFFASRMPENAQFLSLDGSPAPTARFAVPYDTVYGWWLEDGERFLLFFHDPGKKMARLQLYLPTSSNPIEILDIHEPVASLLPYDRARFDGMKASDQLVLDGRMSLSVKRLAQWSPAAFDRASKNLALTVIAPGGEPFRKSRFWGGWSCPAVLKRIDIGLSF